MVSLNSFLKQINTIISFRGAPKGTLTSYTVISATKWEDPQEIHPIVHPITSEHIMKIVSCIAL